MNAIKNRCSLVVVALVIALGVTSCVCPVFIKATGNLGQTVTFKFFKSADDEKPSKFDVVGFTVQEQSTDGRWVTIWHLNGKKSLSEIEYGRKYEGLDEIIPSKPLKHKVRYRALVSATTWPKPGLGEAGIDFFFDEAGNPTQSGTRVGTAGKQAQGDDVTPPAKTPPPQSPPA